MECGLNEIVGPVQKGDGRIGVQTSRRVHLVHRDHLTGAGQLHAGPQKSHRVRPVNEHDRQMTPSKFRIVIGMTQPIESGDGRVDDPECIADPLVMRRDSFRRVSFAGPQKRALETNTGKIRWVGRIFEPC